MLTISDIVIALVSLFLLNSFRVFVRARCQNTLPIPPGPLCLPIIGSLLSIPTHVPGKVYAAWSRKYKSDLIAVRAFGQLSIIINSKQAAQELYERRSAVFADRPRWTMLELTGWNFAASFTPYSQEWRAQRKILNHSLHPSVTPMHNPILLTKVQTLLTNLYVKPEDFRQHLHHHAASNVMAIAYGYDVKRANDPFVDVGTRALLTLADCQLPGARMVNAMPMMRYLPHWLPGMGFMSYTARAKALVSELQDGPFAYAKRSLIDGTACPSLASAQLELNDAQGGGVEGEKTLKRALATFFAGKTVTVFASSILALVLHPSVQKRAQAELDRVVGHSRLPTFEDQPSLPYISAICREAMRWNVPVPLAVAHSPTQDEIYDGMLIPEGAAVMLNAWGILHDPETYPDPETFKPERFLTAEGALNDDDLQVVFGFGRRSCVGVHLANERRGRKRDYCQCRVQGRTRQVSMISATSDTVFGN
ncbi:cytochrome P450 [Artomyces pyxidatus]|uniref:Cytochrome P450 n=1 Tax=Artomyces pyxidatus TaxID=48021 RepID=A0ACB8SVN0_9AGAM|nr:cytochrome P450 [Artomyces pyxidatus]